MEAMTLAPRNTFFDLPSEIRNEIYTLVVYHYDTGGIISPLGDEHNPKVSISLLDNKRYAIKNGRRCYSVTPSIPGERLQLENFNLTSNVRSNHLCTRFCLKPPRGISNACRQLREEALAVFYGIHTFHFEMSNFEITDSHGLPTHSWSPTRWWRAIGDTNLRRITTLNLVCHPDNSEFEGLTVLFRYRWVGRNIEVRFERLELLAWEKAKRAKMGRTSDSRPTTRHPLDMTRFDSYRMQKFVRGNDFEAKVEPLLKVFQTSGVHVRALEQVVAALEPWDAEYLQDHISLGHHDLLVGNVREGRGELALKWDFLS